MTLTILLWLLFIFTLCSAYLSASETALFSLSGMKVRSFRQSPQPRNRLIADLLSRPRDLIVTILMLNILVNILIQNLASTIFGEMATWALKVGVPLAITLFFGEVIPKSVAILNNDRIAPKVAPIIARIEKILGPAIRIVIAVAGTISRTLFFFLKKEKKNIERSNETSPQDF